MTIGSTKTNRLRSGLGIHSNIANQPRAPANQAKKNAPLALTPLVPTAPANNTESRSERRSGDSGRATYGSSPQLPHKMLRV